MPVTVDPVALDELEEIPVQNFGAHDLSAPAVAHGGNDAVVWPSIGRSLRSRQRRSARRPARAIEHATLCRVSSLTNALESMRASGVTVVGLDMDGPTAIDAVDLRGSVTLVVGAEGKGLRKTVKRCCDHLARLPMSGSIASLNASVSIAIALYEARRQRSHA